MLAALFLAALAGQPPVPAPPPVPVVAPANRFGSLFIDWRAAGEAALREEQARARGFGTSGPAPERQARVLGEQVGEMVALGDCDGGERLARDAGDLALARAVQDHCGRQLGGVLANSGRPPPERR